MTAVKTKHEPLETYLTAIEKAKTFKELLDPGADPKKWYLRYCRVCHPDTAPAHYKKRSEEGFKKLGDLYAVFTNKPKEGQCVIAGCVVTAAFTKGDICDLYCAESEKDPKALLKIVRFPKDNDLMDREKVALETLWKAGPDNFTHYFPVLNGCVKASGRRVNILHNEEGYYRLEEIATWQDGIDFRHIVWMVNRALSVLGFAHKSGIVHGAVMPSHLLYNAANHHLKLVDWCYSCTKDQIIPAIVKDYKGVYPPEVKKKMRPGPWTDIYMLMKSMGVVTKNVPKRFRDLITWCIAEPPASRPQDAWELQDRWNKLAKDEYGEPKFVELKLNKN